MSWVTAIWFMVAASCLTLAALHALVWSRDRSAWGNALFSLSAVATAATAGCELWMMHASTGEEFGAALRWLHVPIWLLVVSLVGFVWTYLRAGSRWLGWTVIGVRTLSLIVNFIASPNLNYREITGLREISFLGESAVVAEGTSSPLMLIGQTSLLLLLAFIVDAAVTVWRRGDRSRAVRVVGSMVVFVLAGSGQAILALWGIVPMPLTPSLFYVGIIASMAYELSDDLLRAAKMSRALRESERRVKLASESAGLGLWVWDAVRDEIWAAPHCRAIFGFGPDEPLRFADFRARLHPDEREPVERRVRAALEDFQPYEGECRLVLPGVGGGERWIAIWARVECDEAGAAWRLHGVCREITERRRSQQEAETLRQEITHVGRVSLMGQLASALAHEINQPLGAILRNAEAAELFLQSCSPDLTEIRAILADIRKDDQRAGAVIDRMRAMLKRHVLETRCLDVSELIDEVVSLARADAAARQVKLDVAVPEGMPSALGDRIQLQQVLLNLIINGMDAQSCNGGCERRVTISARVEGPRTVEIAVSDSGQGIPQSEIAEVFNPFFTTKPNGMGMGLSISRAIIEAHGGTIVAQNNAGHGATFSLHVAEGGATGCIMSAPAGIVYLVDDDLSFLTATSRLLRASGFAVKPFASAVEFLVQLDTSSMGCVVADLEMPGMNGVELQATLALTCNPLPILFLTGQGDIASSVRAMRGGAEDFLEKRAAKEKLLEAIRRALARDARERGERQRRKEARMRLETLTEREREVLSHVVQGRLNKQIADDLGIGERTVKLHRTAITTKLGVPSVAELTRIAEAAGLFAGVA